RAERVWGQLVTGSYFEVLGVRPLLGRAFGPEVDGEKARVVVLSHGLWRRLFGADPGIVGSAITIDNQSFTVVGGAPPAFRGTVMGLQFDLWVPLSLQPQLVPGGDRLEDRGNRWLDVLARLKPGATRERAQAELDAIGARLMRDFPATNEGRRLAAYE